MDTAYLKESLDDLAEMAFARGRNEGMKINAKQLYYALDESQRQIEKLEDMLYRLCERCQTYEIENEGIHPDIQEWFNKQQE